MFLNALIFYESIRISNVAGEKLDANRSNILSIILTDTLLVIVQDHIYEMQLHLDVLNTFFFCILMIIGDKAAYVQKILRLNIVPLMKY